MQFLQHHYPFLACIYAGIIAVPTYLPIPQQLERTLPRLINIVKDSQPNVILCTTDIFEKAQYLIPLNAWLCVDQVEQLEEQYDWNYPSISESSIAFLQYTSGSTKQPRGVILTHANLIHNLRQLSIAFQLEQQEQNRLVSWLPPYHDMGLIGAILASLFANMEMTLFSPLDFLRKPWVWLQTLSRKRATHMVAPNFAYELCVRKIDDEQKKLLDLSTIKVACVGAEPIHPQTLNKFADAFASCGFDRNALTPTYGLAEATLMVSAGSVNSPPIISTYVDSQNKPHAMVGCGHSWLEQEVYIVDPVTFMLCPENSVGEIWVKGTSIAQGYWNNTEETQKTFQAFTIPDQKGPFLRTGDLGFIKDNELFVTGRLKDLIIIRGVKYYPHEIELCAEQAHSFIRPGCSAAFVVPFTSELIVLVEVDKKHLNQHVNTDEITKSIQHQIEIEFGLTVYKTIVLNPNTIPKTSSGKVQRFLCLEFYKNNRLETLD